jgi:hypothetical protein
VHLIPGDSRRIDARNDGKFSPGCANTICACRICRESPAAAGFIQPVASGTYRVVPENAHTIWKTTVISHASNLSISMAVRLAQMTKTGPHSHYHERSPWSAIEVDMVERMTGVAKTAAMAWACHYLNHKAVWKLLSSMLGREPERINRRHSAHWRRLLGGGARKRPRERRFQSHFPAIPRPTARPTTELLPLLEAIDHTKFPPRN